MMFLLTVLLGFAQIMLLRVKYNCLINPITLIMSYFYMMLSLSQLSLTGLSAPSDITVVYFLISFSSVFVGAMFAKSTVTLPPNSNMCHFDSTFYTNKKKLILFLSIFAVLPVAYIVTNNLGNIFGGNYFNFVADIRFSGDKVSVAGSVLMTSIVERISRPLSVVTAIIGISLFFNNKDKFLLLIAIFLVVSLSVVYVKRVDLMFFTIMFVGGYLASRTTAAGNHHSKIKLYILFFSIVTTALVISSFRASSYGLYELLLHYGVGYHTYGFLLLDYALNDPASHIHDWVIPGTTTFGTLSFLFEIFSRIFNLDYTSVASHLYGKELGNSIFMGYNSFDGAESNPNAFYTSLYPLYRDMKFFGLIFPPLIYGYFFSFSFLKYRKTQSVRFLMWLVFFTYLGYGSLLTPIIMGNTFWLIPLFIFIFTRIRLK